MLHVVRHKTFRPEEEFKQARSANIDSIIIAFYSEKHLCCLARRSVSIQKCALYRQAGSDRLADGLFERNAITIICETVHQD